jgi:hypothetical protein
MNQVLALAVAVAALLVSAIALLYSRRQTHLAAKQLELASRIRVEAAEPYVVVDIVPQVGGSGLLQFRVENIGPTLARDVRMSVSPPLQGGESDEWDQRLARVVARKMPVLPPGRRIEWYFAFGPRLFENPSLPRQYTVTVNANGPAGPVSPLTYVLDLDVINESALERGTAEASLAKIADHTKRLQEIPNVLRVVADGLTPRTSPRAPRIAPPAPTDDN